MEKKFLTRFKKAWNVFMNKDPTFQYPQLGMGSMYNSRPDRIRGPRFRDQSIMAPIFNRIAIDCASIGIRHVKTDEDGRFLEVIDSGLNNCLTIEANVDQTSRAFIQDAVQSLLEYGVIAIVPVDTDVPINDNGSFDILSLRVGLIKQWMPRHVQVDLYNDRTGEHVDLTLSKESIAIVQNPLYSIVNDENSTLKRLVRKMRLLDASDERLGSNKLDLVIQLPYTVKSELKREQVKKRINEIEDQLENSPHGIAYTDATEKITQLNRPIENNLQSQIEYLTTKIYSELGITMEVMNGTADEKTMTNYERRTVEPILAAIIDEMIRSFLTKTARTQRQTIMMFRDPFKLVPMAAMAELADKLTRNEIATGNEVRQGMGMRPSKDPSADELRNKNLSAPKGGITKHDPDEHVRNKEEDYYQNE